MENPGINPPIYYFPQIFVGEDVFLPNESSAKLAILFLDITILHLTFKFVVFSRVFVPAAATGSFHSVALAVWPSPPRNTHVKQYYVSMLEVCAVHRFGVLLKTAHHPTRRRPVPVP